MYRSLLLDKFEHRGHFEGGRVETLFPLLKCYRTPKLQDFAHTISRWYSRTSERNAPRCLDPDTNFRLAHQRSHRSCFTKWPLLHTTWNWAHNTNYWIKEIITATCIISYSIQQPDEAILSKTQDSIWDENMVDSNNKQYWTTAETADIRH